MRAAPSLGVLLGLLALMAILPLCSALGFGEVGGYRMFTRLARLELTVHAIEADGRETPVPLERLRPHLGSDARRIVGAALRGQGTGDAAEGALTAALPELARLGCAIDPGARQIHAALTVTHTGAPPERREIEHGCVR